MAVKTKNFGFTLIEMLIVIMVLGLVSVIGSNLFIGTLLGSSKAEILKEVRQNGEYALGIMEEMIKYCANVKDCESNSITIKVGNDQAVTFKVLDDAGVARIASNSSYLTSNKVKVVNFSVSCGTLVPGRPASVVINYSVEQKELTARPENKASMQFYTIVTTRNVYQEKLD